MEPDTGSFASSHCTLSLIEGEIGLGKSWLIEEALKGTSTELEEPLLCCRVQCHERQGIPFLPILRLIKDLILQSGEESALWKRYAHVLSRVFPELALVLGEEKQQDPLPGKSGRIQFHEALGEILFEMAQGRTLILVLHDLHRSDPGTVEFVEFLARNSSLSWNMSRHGKSDSGSGDTRDWKQIRSREGKSGEFASSIIDTENGKEDYSDPGGRLLLLADFSTEKDKEVEGPLKTLLSNLIAK